MILIHTHFLILKLIFCTTHHWIFCACEPVIAKKFAFFQVISHR